MIQPASKGPFVQVKASIVDAEYVTRATFYGGPNGAADAHANARYFAHAANVLPGCVEAMAAVSKAWDSLTDESRPKYQGCDLEGQLAHDAPFVDAYHSALRALKAALDAARGER